MPKYELSNRARTDLSSIGRFTKKKWGDAQTERYLAQLERDLELPAYKPGLGRSAGSKREPDMRRFESGSHIVFYEITDDGILIGRILHKRMLLKKHGI
jgi:toxin ParE1/3/4